MKPSPEARLTDLIHMFVDERSISRTKILAQKLRATKRGETLYIPFGLDSYNTVYRRVQRIARKTGRFVEIRKAPMSSGMIVKITGTQEEVERILVED